MRVIVTAAIPVLLAAMSAPSAVGAERTVIDMSGHPVTVNVPAKRVVTVGSAPVINSFVFALGEARAIVSGLPEFARNRAWKYQPVFAPQVMSLPQMQGANRAPTVEAILQAAPDAVITLDRSSVDVLRRNELRTIFLAWREPEDVKKVMQVLGQVFDKPAEAAAYASYFDETVARVRARLASAHAAQPRVLYMEARSLNQPHLIAEWWIDAAGGKSMTGGSRTTESLPFTLEQLLAWDPDVILLSTAADRKAFMEHSVMREVRAAKAKRVHVVPTGSHRWGNRTIEQPLTVLWTATKLYPEVFADVDMAKETADFYRRFFKHELKPEQVAEILSGDL